ncbi:MAG: Na+/H+ antiporter subunit E [Acidimicrobiales bacterium]
MAQRVLALFLWCFGAWVLLTWTRTWSQLLFGVGVSAVVAAACAPLGPVIRPWRLCSIRRLIAIVRLCGVAFVRIVGANLSLSRRIWTPSLPLRSGMVIVHTRRRGEGELAATGLITSLIVDNQIVDLDRREHELQYHCVWVASESPEENYEAINGPVEKWLWRLSR